MLRVDGLDVFDMFEANYAPLLEDVVAGWDWAKLRTAHDGVIIAPYRWERRFEAWYYGLDCGVIWNLDVVAELRLVPEEQR